MTEFSRPIRVILILILVFNILGVALSEVQRRQLGLSNFEATLELRKIEQERMAQQEVELIRAYKLLNEINQRVTNVELAVTSGELANESKSIEKRLDALQGKIAEIAASR